MWVILGGLDRTGKTTVAEYFIQQGYEYVKFNAPDKKFFDTNYKGLSYFEEIVELFTSLSGKNIVFDRFFLGELIWPQVYGRRPQLTEEQMDILKEMADAEDAEYILMHDTDKQAHWDRCLANNEPLTRQQFIMAGRLYDKLLKYGYKKTTLPEFCSKNNYYPDQPKQSDQSEQNSEPVIVESIKEVTMKNDKIITSISDQQMKLLKANAINSILSTRILKRKDEIFDKLEDDIREFLQVKLAALFGDASSEQLTKEEILILKDYVKLIQNKLKGVK